MTTPTGMAAPHIRTNTTTMKTSARILAAAAAFSCLAPGAWCQDYPTKPIRVIVPYAAGGGADLLARLVGQELSQRLKQPVIVENQGGGSNTIGMRTVANAPRDGYTLGLATPVFVMTPALIKNHPYDPLKDFTPLPIIVSPPRLLVAHPGVP